MKKLLLSLTSLVMLTACSNDDTASTNNEGPQLVRLLQTSYYNGVIDGNNIIEINDDKLLKISYYNAQNILGGHDTIWYNSNGLASAIKGFSVNNEQRTESNYFYDTQGRLSHYNIRDGSYLSTTTNTFNSNQTITAVTTDAYNTNSKTYFTNSDNLIWKEIAEFNTYEVVYSGFNGISGQGYYYTKTFEYLDAPLPPANYNLWSKIFGSYKANTVLAANILGGNEYAYATKYIKKRTDGDSVVEYRYIFNDNQLPLKVTEYFNGVLNYETEYIYE